MKILCDHQIFSSFAYSGISRYFCELFCEFNQMQIQWDVSCFFSNNKFLKNLKHYPGFFPEQNFRGKNRLLENINLLKTRQALKKGDFDIFHSTYSKPYDRNLLKGKPYIITVHDMTHEKYGAKLPSGVRETAEEKESIARADGIICPSYATRDDLIAIYPEAAEKTTVIYHGVRLPEVIPTELFADFRPYFLYVGSRMFYKDFPTAVKAVSMLPPEYNLLCVGGECEFRASSSGKTIILGGDKLFKYLSSLASADGDTLISSGKKEKSYILDGSEPFLRALGVSDENGRVYDRRQAKFRQINRFLELIRDIEGKLPSNGVYAGNPAKFICSIEEWTEKHIQKIAKLTKFW